MAILSHLHSYELLTILMLQVFKFRYLQIRDGNRLPDFDILAEHEPLEAINKYDPASREVVSLSYQILHNRAPPNTAGLKQALADELNIELKDWVWDECM